MCFSVQAWVDKIPIKNGACLESPNISYIKKRVMHLQKLEQILNVLAESRRPSFIEQQMKMD